MTMRPLSPTRKVGVIRHPRLLVIREIKSAIFTYFKSWWLPIAAYSIPIAIYVLSEILKRDVLFALAVYTVNTLIVINILAIIVQLFSTHWLKAIAQFVIMGVMYLLMAFTVIWVAPDHYGAHKEIPSNIDIVIPADLREAKPILGVNDFIITQGLQGGIYEYFTTYHPKQLGHFFIKAYEITSNDRLSKNRLDFESKIEVTDLTAPLYSGEFKIYEGSWYDKYAARIELWYQPQDGAAYQVTQKNYVIEGWMR